MQCQKEEKTYLLNIVRNVWWHINNSTTTDKECVVSKMLNMISPYMWLKFLFYCFRNPVYCIKIKDITVSLFSQYYAVNASMLTTGANIKISSALLHCFQYLSEMIAWLVLKCRYWIKTTPNVWFPWTYRKVKDLLRTCVGELMATWRWFSQKKMFFSLSNPTQHRLLLETMCLWR